jgi:hypothetical protein
LTGELPQLTRTGRLQVGPGRRKGRESLDWKSTNFLYAILLGVDTEIEDNVVGHIPANTPLGMEQAARAVGLRIERARRLMVDPKFAAELEKKPRSPIGIFSNPARSP